MKRLLAGAALAVMVLVVVTCGDDGPTGPVAGTLSVELTSPNTGVDKGILLTVTGPTALTSATAGSGLRLYGPPLGGLETRFALVGQMSNGVTILTIGVEDVGRVSEYSAAIEGVARADYQLRNLSGYELTVGR
jgi:hypothetical protein